MSETSGREPTAQPLTSSYSKEVVVNIIAPNPDKWKVNESETAIPEKPVSYSQEKLVNNSSYKGPKVLMEGYDFEHQRLLNVGLPMLDSDGVNKSYLDWKMNRLKVDLFREVQERTNGTEESLTNLVDNTRNEMKDIRISMNRLIDRASDIGTTSATAAAVAASAVANSLAQQQQQQQRKSNGSAAAHD